MNERQYRERTEFLSNMLEEVYKVPVEEVVGSVVDLVQKGRYYLGLCPFHPDHNLGSFVVTPGMNIWRCFAEGIGGTPVKFYMKYYDVPFLEAAFMIAKDFNIITEEEYRKYSGKSWNSETVNRIRKTMEEPKKHKKTPKADPEVFREVYNAIPKVCSLSENHRKHLVRERHLNPDHLQDYFTFPTRKMDLAGKVFAYIADEKARELYGKSLSKLSGEEVEVLSGLMRPVSDQMKYVPGFFYKNSTGRIDFSSFKGIGMMCRDDHGNPLGIQIRRDTVKDGESRYIWFSSAFAQSMDDAEGGNSPGSPGGIIFAQQNKKKPVLCITEGRFKAEQIAAKGNNAIYVSGVSTWKSVLPLISRTHGDSEIVLLMFDSDMLGNAAVHRQLRAFAGALSEMELKPKVVLWAIENGKGFDDLVVNKGNRYSSFLKYMDYQAFDRVYQEVSDGVMRDYGICDIKDLPGERSQEFVRTLQKKMEEKLGLKVE